MIEAQLLAAAVAHYRAAAGLSQKDAAHAAGVHQNAWQRIEAGKGNPQLSTLVAIAYTLRVPVNALLCRLNPKSLQHAETK